MVIAKTEEGQIFEILKYAIVPFADGHCILVRDPGDYRGFNLRWLQLSKLRITWVRVFNF